MTLGQAFLGQRYAAILHRTLAEANRRISLSLEEKEVLLREIHHRVKNNLQIVSSLLSMQSDRTDGVNDAKTVDALKASQQRIAAMAQIHDSLYSTEQIGEIDLAKYVRELAEMAISSFQSDIIRIRSRFDLTPLLLSMNQAVPCGLIVNELVTNVFKYAYPNGESGEIYIGVKPTGDDGVSITISDNGVGMPDGLDWKRSNSLGLRIINILTGQLGGTIELDAQHGASFTLKFTREA
jgi:two-component sensor histidine kinase